MQKKLIDLMVQDLALPVVPAAMARVIQAFDAPNPSTEVLARDIADDPVLTMHLLHSQFRVLWPGTHGGHAAGRGAPAGL